MTNWGALVGAGLAGLGGYLDYKDKKDRQKELDKQYSAYRYAQMQGAAAQGSSGGGGGKSAMQSLLMEYYKKAQDLYQPYVDAGKQVLPAQTAAYMQGLPSAQNYMGQTLDPDFIRQSLTYNRPDGPELPSYLAGGKK